MASSVATCSRRKPMPNVHELGTEKKFTRSPKMSDEDIALKAVSAAQEILEEYLEPRPRSNERMILDRLVEILGRLDLFVAVSRRMQRANGASSG